MARFNEEWLAQLLAKSDIVEVIGEYVRLEKRGTRLWACCPWHNERNASFCVNPEKQMFYCFSCKKGGGVINFIMENEKLSFPEAVELLARRAGMELPEFSGNESYQKQKEYKKRLTVLMKDLAFYYNQNLFSAEGSQALAYVEKRGIYKVSRSFGLGFAKNEFDDAYRFLLGKGYTQKEMLDAGVVRSKNGRFYDFFRGRVMFPIQNVFGDVIAFGGRVMDDGEPKYLNTGETLLFNKRNNLYALNLVRKNRNLRNILLTEGYMDVVGLAAGGINNVVASLGTSLTSEQARLIKRYTTRVYLCYDGDAAGVKASLRAIDILGKEGLHVFAMLLPEGLDPDDYVKKYGAVRFKELGKSALSGMAFKLRVLEGDFDLEQPDQVVEYATKAVAMIALLENEIEKERFLRQLSKTTGLSENSLKMQLNKENTPQRYSLPANELNLIKKSKDDEEKLIAVLLEQPSLVQNNMHAYEGIFQNSLYQKIYSYISEEIKKGIVPTYAELLSVFSAEGDQIAFLLAENIPDEVTAEGYAEMLVRKIHISRLKSKREQLLGEVGQAWDEAKREELMRNIADINLELHKMSGNNF